MFQLHPQFTIECSLKIEWPCSVWHKTNKTKKKVIFTKQQMFVVYSTLVLFARSRMFHFTRRPPVTSYLVHLKLIHLNDTINMTPHLRIHTEWPSYKWRSRATHSKTRQLRQADGKGFHGVENHIMTVKLRPLSKSKLRLKQKCPTVLSEV